MASTIASAPPEPTLHALRSAQLRSRRDQRKGKMFSRTLLVFMSIGALLGTALTVGRPLLFPTDWDATLTPIVDDIQEATGTEFDHTVAVVVQSADDYASDLLASTVGAEWADSVPIWRALGLAEGDVTPASVAAALAERQTAFYDPISGTIHQMQGRQQEELRPALETALLVALRDQLRPAADVVSRDPGAGDSGDAVVVEPVQRDVAAFTGVSSRLTLAARAVEASVVERTATDVFGATQSADTAFDVPIPIAYEIAAAARLGEAILLASGADLESVALDDGRFDPGRDWLDDQPIIGLNPQLRADDRAVSAPVSLGIDDWTLVWGARLPVETVDRLARIVSGDSFQPIVRDGAVCFAGVLQTGNEIAGSSLLTALQQWAASSAAGSQAVASQLDPNTVQIEACDPGTAASTLPDPGTVDSLIDRQIARLTR